MYLLRSLFLSFLVCLFGFSFQQMAHAKTVDYPAPSINFKSAFSFTNQTTQATDITQYHNCAVKSYMSIFGHLGVYPVVAHFLG